MTSEYRISINNMKSIKVSKRDFFIQLERVDDNCFIKSYYETSGNENKHVLTLMACTSKEQFNHAIDSTKWAFNRIKSNEYGTLEYTFMKYYVRIVECEKKPVHPMNE